MRALLAQRRQGARDWARDGKFSTKLSFIVALLYMFCPVGGFGLAGAWLGRVGGSALARAPAAPSNATRAAASPCNPTHVALWMLIGVAVAPWVLGWPAYLSIEANTAKTLKPDMFALR